MLYTTLGNTDLKVSKICLGTMTFGEQNTEAEGHEQLDYALEQGINFIDTAELYAVPSNENNQGNTERIIGTWINARKNRDQYVLATKITGPSPNLSYIRNPLKFNREQINIAIDQSLQRLQTDYVDLYQLHWPERRTNFFGKRGFKHSASDPWEDNFLAILEVMQELVKQGKIRHFGISNETPWGMMNYLRLAEKHDLPRCMSIQNPYSLLNRLFEVGLAEMAIREEVGLLAYSPMAFGRLSGKYNKGTDTPDSRLNKYGVMSRYNKETSLNATAAYLKIAEDNGMSLAQMSLAFVTQQAFVTSNIIGASSLDQLKENIASIDITLSKDILKAIEEVQDLIPNPAP
jgi:aryl-alcohol dehydrogenase-like predicted oxidoreductase